LKRCVGKNMGVGQAAAIEESYWVVWLLQLPSAVLQAQCQCCCWSYWQLGCFGRSCNYTSIQLPFLNHQPKPPNFFLCLSSCYVELNWLSNSVSRRRRNLCLCGRLRFFVPILWSCLSTLSLRVTWSRSMHIHSYVLTSCCFHCCFCGMCLNWA
jgi:hypothetical protein